MITVLYLIFFLRTQSFKDMYIDLFIYLLIRKTIQCSITLL